MFLPAGPTYGRVALPPKIENRDTALHKDFQLLLDRKFSRKLQSIEKTARIRLELLDAATSLRGLELPGLRLEARKGDRKGQHSIRVNDQFRICFEWRDGDAHDGKLSTTTESRHGHGYRQTKKLPPIHPGDVLQDLLAEAGLTTNALALALRVPAIRIGSIIKGQRGITADTALCLARYFGTSAQMWLNLQSKYDLAVAEDTISRRIEREVLPRSA